MADTQTISNATSHFATILQQQLERVERLKQDQEWTNFAEVNPIRIGILGGDGIGPAISAEARRVLEYLLRDQVESGKIVFRYIDGLTIENRAEHMQSIPDDVLAEIHQCHVTLKGPTHTPEKGDGWPNLESANVSMRKALDLFANVRPSPHPRRKHRLDLLPREHGRPLRRRQPGHQRHRRSRHRLPRHHHPGFRAHHRRCLRPRPAQRQGTRHHRHQGQHYQDHRRQVPGHRPAGLRKVPLNLLGRMVHRHHDCQAP